MPIMNNASPPHQPDLALQVWRNVSYQRVDTLRSALPPPIDDTP